MGKNKNNKGTLGRGLSALIESNTLEGYKEVNISDIKTNPYQPRVNPSHKVEELAKSVKELGIISPLIVTQLDDRKYQLIAGERRLIAATQAGLKKIPVIVKNNVKNVDMLIIAIIENLQREDLNIIEEATAVEELIDEFKLDKKEVARELGISLSKTVTLYKIAKLSEKIKVALRNEEILINHAILLLRLPTPEDQLLVINKIINENLSINAVKALVINILAEKYKLINDAFIYLPQQSLEMQVYLQGLLKSDKVEIKRSFAGRGYIKIPFTTDKELNDIFHALKH